MSINTLTPEGRCIGIYKHVVLEFPYQIKEVLDTVEEKGNKYPDLKIDCSLGFHYNLPESYAYFEQNPENYKMKHLKDGCGAASTSCTVTPTGDVIPCEGLSDFVGGNIREHDLLDLWESSENFKRIRELNKVSMAQTPYCNKCKYIFLCDGGCRATAHMVYKDLKAPSIHCPFWDVSQEGENLLLKIERESY